MHHRPEMDPADPSSRPDRKKKSTHAHESSKPESPRQGKRRARFSPEEECYLAHHVNQCHDFQDLCQKFNTKFGTNCTLRSLDKFLSRCNDSKFLDLTEQAQDYRWCTPHSMSPSLPPSMVLGTAEWRTELRAFLIFGASNNMPIADLKERLLATFPDESRTFGQITTQLAQIHQKQGLVRQLEWFAASYPWHPAYKAAPSASKKANTKGLSQTARATPWQPFNQRQQRLATIDPGSAAASAPILTTTLQPAPTGDAVTMKVGQTPSLETTDTGGDAASEEVDIFNQVVNALCHRSTSSGTPSATNAIVNTILGKLSHAIANPAPGLTYEEALAMQSGLFAESARAPSAEN